MNFKPVMGEWANSWLNGKQVWLMIPSRGPEPAQYCIYDKGTQVDPYFQLLDGGTVNADAVGLTWAPLEVPSKQGESLHPDNCVCLNCIGSDGIGEVITKDDLREVVKAMDACYILVEKAQAICTSYLTSEKGAAETYKFMSEIMTAFDGPTAQTIQYVAQQLFDKYDESRVVSAVEAAPLTGGALEQAAEEFLEQLALAIYGDLAMNQTVKEIREEHEATWPPEVVAYVRGGFAKEGSKF